MKIGESLPFGFEDTSYQAAGGPDGVADLVNSFYDIMDILPEAEHIRGLHPEDLSLSREKLIVFLSGWLGGPTKYAERFGPINIPKAHAHLNATDADKEAWLLCMQKAIAQQPYSKKFSKYLIEQLRVPAERIVLAGKKS